MSDQHPEGEATRSVGRERLTQLRELIQSNITAAITIGTAAYILIRGQVSSYGNRDLPFLISVLIGLTGLTALEWVIERKTRIAVIDKKLDGVNERNDAMNTALADISSKLRTLTSSIDAVAVGAHVGSFLEGELPLPQERMKRARKILWSGVSLQYVLPQGLGALEKAVEHRAEITILVADPRSSLIMQEINSHVRPEADRLDGFLKSAVLNLQLLAMQLPPFYSFRLGFHQVLPSYGLLLVDPDDDDGVCYVNLHHPDQRTNCSFVLHATRDEYWYRVFASQFEMWAKSARTIEVSQPSNIEDAVDSSDEED